MDLRTKPHFNPEFSFLSWIYIREKQKNNMWNDKTYKEALKSHHWFLLIKWVCTRKDCLGAPSWILHTGAAWTEESLRTAGDAAHRGAGPAPQASEDGLGVRGRRCCTQVAPLGVQRRKSHSTRAPKGVRRDLPGLQGRQKRISKESCWRTPS